MSLALWVTGMRSAAEGMTPSGINLSGNVPLRLGGKDYKVKDRDNKSHSLGYESRRRKRVQSAQNAHLGQYQKER